MASGKKPSMPCERADAAQGAAKRAESKPPRTNRAKEPKRERARPRKRQRRCRFDQEAQETAEDQTGQHRRSAEASPGAVTGR